MRRFLRAVCSTELDPSVRVVALGLARESRGIVDAALGNLRRLRAIRAMIRDLKPDVTIGMMTSASVLVAFAGLGLPSRTLGVERNYPGVRSVRPALDAGS